MSDSLDMLLTTRISSASRRPAPVSSPLGARTGVIESTPRTSRGQYAAETSSYSYSQQPSPSAAGAYSSRNATPSSSTTNSYSSSFSQSKPPTASPSPSSTNYSSNNFSYPQQSRVDSSSFSSSSSLRSYEPSLSPANTSLGASLASSLTAKLSESSSEGGSVNWSSFKAKRAASANPNNAPAAQQLSSPVSAAPAASAAAANNKPSGDASDTVIDGAMIFPVRKASPPANSSTASLTSSSNNAAAPLVPRPSARSMPVAPAAASGATTEPGQTARPIQTFSCPDCGRNFKRGSLMKHQRVCKKVFQSKRGPFDSKAARTADMDVQPQDDDLGEDCEEADGEELLYGNRPMTGAHRPTTGQVPTTGAANKQKKVTEESKEEDAKSSWKDQSESLREAMRRAKKQKAQFGNSNSLGIDLRAMMPKQVQ